MSRRRERRIEYIIEKVLLWRKYMNGLYINGIFEKYDSKKAAEIVGVSKKSLDDYTKLIRIGRKLYYNFNKNRNKRISDLKSFIKKNL
jgi:histone acetyltransferase (RNA polymerase elongator complex component)